MRARGVVRDVPRVGAQAFGRAVFSELIPKGHESDMFALFEITDKGSSWMGPLIAASVRAADHRKNKARAYLPAVRHGAARGAAARADLEPSIRAAKGDTALAIDGTEDAEDVKC